MQFIAFAALFTFIIVSTVVFLVLAHNVGRIRHHAHKFEEVIDDKSLTPREIENEAKAIVAEHDRYERAMWDRALRDSIERTRRERNTTLE